MFPFLLIVILGTADAPQPVVVAGFRDLATCEMVASHMTFPNNALKMCRKATRA